MLDSNPPPLNTQVPEHTDPQLPLDQSIVAGKPSSDHIASVKKLADELKRLIEGCESAKLTADVKGHIDRLNTWTGTYLAGLDAAQKISETASGTLVEAQKQLGLALDEYLRLENEGGNPATPQQARMTTELSHTLEALTSLIPAVDIAFSEADPPEETPDSLPEVEPVSEPEGNPDVLPEIPPVDSPDMMSHQLRA